MRRAGPLSLLLLTLALLRPAVGSAQEWTPPSRAMPSMPRVAELGAGGWLASPSPWFDGVEQLSGVAVADLRAAGEPRSGSDVAQVVRISRGPLPVVVWVDRNGDSRADMVEIYRSGGVIIQVVDADYDGSANVMRVYDASGTLVREAPM